MPCRRSHRARRAWPGDVAQEKKVQETWSIEGKGAGSGTDEAPQGKEL